MFTLSSAELDALLLSLQVAIVATGVSLPLGVLTAWVLARKNFIGKSVIDGFIHLPLVVPPVVIGYLLLVLLGRNGPLGGLLFDVFGITVAFTWKGAAIAAAVMAFPLMVRAIRLSIEAADQRLETAARTLGAGPLRVFWTITLPQILPGILVGLVLAFARSLGEFGATIAFVSNIPGETRTLPLAIFTLLQAPGTEDAVIRLVVISVAVALAALIASEILSRRISRRLRGAA